MILNLFTDLITVMNIKNNIMKQHWFPILLFIIIAVVIVDKSIIGYKKTQEENKAFKAYVATEAVDTVWRGYNKTQIPVNTESGKLIMYGHELIANTAFYLGPKGTVTHTTNGMNCQNCHLDGGTIPYGNNFGKVFATYPLFRARNNGVQTIYNRVNDCFERSLNGKALDSTTREMKAIYAYMKWLGDEIPKGMVRGGTSIMKLKYLDRAAEPVKGKAVYTLKCQACHGDNGQGMPNAGTTGFIYPPLWGEHSYNDGAGLFRLSSFAGFVKNNMPFGTNYHDPNLSDEEAWDLAAFVNSQPRPHKDQRADCQRLQDPRNAPFCRRHLTAPVADAIHRRTRQ